VRSPARSRTYFVDLRAEWLRTFTIFTGGDTSRESLYRTLRDVASAEEILPSPDAAGRAWRDFKRVVAGVLDATVSGSADEVKFGASSVKPVAWSEDWFAGLQKKYRPEKDDYIRCPIGQGEAKVQIGVVLYGRNSLTQSGPAVTDLLLSLSFDKIPNRWLVGCFKELSEVAKKWGELLWPSYWPDLVGFESFFGAPPVSGADFAPQLASWVHDRKSEDEVGSDRRRVVEEGLREVARDQFEFKEQMGVDDFFRNPSRWLANGATTGARLPGSKGTKFSTYLASSREDLLRDLFSRAPPQNVVNPKRERTKTRNTISSDWDLYLQMKFLCQGVEDALETVFPTTLGKKVQQLKRWDMWRRKLGRSVGVPIDQSTFDHVPWMELLISLIRVLCDSARRKSPDPELHARLTELVIARIRAGSVKWENYTWRHIRGLLSGWAWTSALGTLLNYVEFVGITIVTRGVIPGKDEFGLQGDDLLAFVRSWNQAVTLTKTYMRVLPVNPGKFFISEKRTEFLRMVITPDRVTGYAMRAVPSLFYANAWSGGKMTVSSTVSSWARLAQRGCNKATVREHAIRDVVGFTRLPRKHVEDALATPKSVGGLGMEVRPGAKWRRVVEESIVDDGVFDGRKVLATDPEQVPPSVRRVATKNIQSHGGMLADPVIAGAAADAVLAGVQGVSWAKPKDSRIRIEPVEVRATGGLLEGRFVGVKPPKTTIDPMFIAPVLRKLLTRGWDAVKDLFAPRDFELVKARWYAWSRNVWFDWVTGRLKPKGWSDWMMGSVVASAVSDAIGFNLWLPRGKVTRQAVVIGMLATESHSRRYHAEDLVWMGG